MNLGSIRSFEGIPQACDYLVLLFAPGAKNPLYHGREEEWAEKQFVGCTGELQIHLEQVPEYTDKHIALRVISTMSAAQEATACEARPFPMIGQSDWFKIIADEQLHYRDFCAAKHPAVKIESGETLYQPHTVILRKVHYNAETKQWAGTCISIQHRNEKPDVLSIVESDCSVKQMFRPSVGMDLDNAEASPRESSSAMRQSKSL